MKTIDACEGLTISKQALTVLNDLIRDVGGQLLSILLHNHHSVLAATLTLDAFMYHELQAVWETSQGL